MVKVFSLSDGAQKVIIPDSTGVYRMENGETFYWSWTPPQHKLYVKSSGREIFAELPCYQISDVGVYKNTFYFSTEEKIYKAVYYDSQQSISVEFLRAHREGERLHYGAFFSQIRNGETYVYRMWEDPEMDAIRLDVKAPYGDLSDIYNGKVIYIEYIGEHTFPSVKKLSDTVYVVKASQESCHTSLHDSSCLYFTHGESDIVVLDLDIMEFLPILSFNELQIINIVCVRRGIITVRANEFCGTVLKSAQLPKAFCDVAREYNKEKKRDAKEFKRREKEDKTVAIGKSNSADAKMSGVNVVEVIAENEKMKEEIKELRNQLIEIKVGALQTVKKTLKFKDFEKLSKPLVCIQLGDGIMLYFDNAKPFELYYMRDGNPVNADLKILDGEYDCSFRGTIGHYAYFATIHGKRINFFSAHIEDQTIVIDQINEMRTSEISLFKSQPFYYVERSKEWSVYGYGEKYDEMNGEKFDISEIDLLSKYERHYHRGVLFLFRETSTAKIKRVNEKVVKIEGALLDQTVSHFYTTPHSDFIYILNSEENVLLILDTTDLTVSQQCYEPPADSNNHSIVGIHDGILTIAFDGVWGRHLSTAKLH